jgi:hypothetical protein
MKYIRPLVLIVLSIAMLLTACGGEEESGVDLQVANQNPTETPIPEPTPTQAPEDSAPGYTGRLFLMTGKTFAWLDLETGSLIPFTDLSVEAGGAPIESFGPAAFNSSLTHGAFVPFPQFGVVDLAAGTVSGVGSLFTFVTSLGISPDGRWLATTIGGTALNRLQLMSTDGTQEYTIRSSGLWFYIFRWTVDSELIWWAVPTEPDPEEEEFVPELMLYDPATQESTPIGDTVYDLAPGGPLNVSPDGSRMVLMPVAPGAENVADPEDCFESYVELLDLPQNTADLDPEGTVIWNEPGMIASSPQWLDDDRILFVRIGPGTCGDVEGEMIREVTLLDLSAEPSTATPILGPLGNENDPLGFNLLDPRFAAQLYSPSPDARYVAWVEGNHLADVSRVNITALDTGETQTVLEFTPDMFSDAASWIEDGLVRQVIWLE